MLEHIKDNASTRCTAIACVYGCVFGLLATPAAAQNLIVNPSFEDTSTDQTRFNLNNPEFNAFMANVTAFGDRPGTGGGMGEMDIMDGRAGFSPLPFDGRWKVGLGHDGDGEGIDAFSFDLLAPIQAGTLYTLSFQAVSVTRDFSPDLAALDIGISDAPDAFGTLIETTDIVADDDWQLIEFNFFAPTDAAYLTIQGTRGPDAWSHLDDFSLIVVPSPGAGAVVFLAAGMLVGQRRRQR